MGQYHSSEGSAGDWHLVHLGSLSMGAAGLLMVEMTNVTMDGRISTRCATLCTDENEASLKRVVDFCKTYGVAQLGIQLGHAGQIGRASCRERVCQYVSIQVVAVSIKKKKPQT